MISGQFISYASGVYSPEGAPVCSSFDACFNAQVEELARQAGKYVGMIGLDYGFSTDEQRKAANETIKLRWKDSGLVTISWHANHPFQMGPFRSGNMVNTGPDENSSLQGAFISLANDLTNNSDTVEAKNWRDSLVKIADRLVDLKNSGYVILWRPFHEMNGDWFWWGKQDSSAFIKIWIHMREYFTSERGLDNLLWVYSPNSGNGKYLEYYPGTKYGDIVGLDIYATPPLTIGGYQELRNLGKPLGLTEFGRGCPDAVTCEEPGGFINPLLINDIRNNYQDISFFQYWHHPWAIISNPEPQTLLSDSWVITKDEIVFLGDFDNNGYIGLEDAILALQIIAGFDTTGKTISINADVDGDGAIGLADVIFVLQRVSGLR